MEFMRPLNEIETQAVKRITEKGSLRLDPTGVAYVRKDNFTVSVVSGTDGNYYIGVSKRNPIDRPSKIRGEAIAFVRAISQ